METPARKLRIFPPLLEPDLPSLGCPGDSVGKESACNVEDPGVICGSGRSSEEGNGNPLQYSCLENSMDRGAWGGYSPWGCKESDTTEKLTLSLLQLRDGIGLLFIPSIIRLYNALIWYPHYLHEASQLLLALLYFFLSLSLIIILFTPVIPFGSS